MNFSRSIIASALLATAGVAQAELSANVSAVSNYYFRGVTQTDDAAAVQGGIDYNHDSGFYLGTWASNIDFDGDDEFLDTDGDGNIDTVNSGDSKADIEIDFYTGFGNDIGDTGISYDVSAWYYWYPSAGGDDQGGDLDYAEVSGSLSWGWITGTVAYTFWAELDGQGPFNDGDLYYNAAVDFPWEYEGFTLSAFVGHYSFDSDGDNSLELNYTHWGAGITKDAGDFGSFSFNYEQADDDDSVAGEDNANFWVGWSKGF